MSALLLVGIDGILDETLPTRDNCLVPFDDNVHAWSHKDQDRLISIPMSLEELLQALCEDHDYLLAEEVFNP